MDTTGILEMTPTSFDNSVIANIIGGVAVVLLGGIVSILWRGYRRFNRFMAEHVWLITTTLWNRDKVLNIMDHLNMPVRDEPPSDLRK